MLYFVLHAFVMDNISDIFEEIEYFTLEFAVVLNNFEDLFCIFHVGIF